MNSPAAIIAQANKASRDAGVTKPPIDLALIASHHQVEIFEEDLKDKADGMLTYLPSGQPVIAVEAKMLLVRKRFCISHEFGHYFLSDHDGAFSCFMPGRRPSKVSPLEAEADSFAVELLMPEDFFKKAFWGLPLGFESIRRLASDFDVSVTSCALRFVSFRKEGCALICCANGTLKWCAPSPSFPVRSLRFNKGGPVPKETYAYDYLQGGVKESKPARPVLARNWFPYCSDGNLMINEECFSAPEFGFVLSFLSFREDT